MPVFVVFTVCFFFIIRIVFSQRRLLAVLAEHRVLSFELQSIITVIQGAYKFSLSDGSSSYDPEGNVVEGSYNDVLHG